jgi:hypothetical protein
MSLLNPRDDARFDHFAFPIELAPQFAGRGPIPTAGPLIPSYERRLPLFPDGNLAYDG